MTRVIDGRKYLMRDQRPVATLRELHRAFCARYGVMDFHRWMVQRGKVYVEIKKGGRT